MISRLFVLGLALMGILSAFSLSREIETPPPKNKPFVEPVSKPYPLAISASGIIEAVKDNVKIGAPTSGLIEEVYVEVSQQVEKGTPLFSLDSRELKAKFHVNLAKMQVAKAKLKRLEDQLARLQGIEDPRAISQEELKTKENDVAIAKSEYRQMIAEAKLTKTMLDSLTIKAPKKGVIMQNSTRKGEWLSQDPKQPAMLLGDLSQLQIRADIDEQNACLVCAEERATAHPKNRPDISIPLKFVKIEPLMIPKQSLTGQSNERVDTRVLQVIYTFDPVQQLPLYVGQQVDVFIAYRVENTL